MDLSSVKAGVNYTASRLVTERTSTDNVTVRFTDFGWVAVLLDPNGGAVTMIPASHIRAIHGLERTQSATASAPIEVKTVDDI